MFHPTRLTPLFVVFTACASTVEGPGSRARLGPSPLKAVADQPVTVLLPADTISAQFMDLQAIRESRLYEIIRDSLDDWALALKGMQEDGEREEPFAIDSFWRLVGDARWILVGEIPQAKETGSETTALIVIGGKISKPQAIALARAQLPTSLSEVIMSDAELSKEPVQVDWSGTRRVVATEQRMVVEVAARVWVTGPPPRVEKLLARLKSEPLAVVSQTRLLDESIGLLSHQMAWSSVDMSVFDVADNEDHDSIGVCDVLVKSGQGFAGWADLSDGVTLDGFVQMKDESSAALVIQGFREKLAHDIEESSARVFGTHRLLERIDARAQGTQVLVEFELDEAASHLWWGRISGAVSMIFVVLSMINDFLKGQL